MINDLSINTNSVIHNVKANVRSFVPGKPGKSPYIGDNGHWYYYDDTTDEWVDSTIPAQGDEGPAGNGIVSIVKTASSGLVDTYTITYDDGTTSTYSVTNGTPYVYVDGDTLMITATVIDADEEEY